LRTHKKTIEISYNGSALCLSRATSGKKRMNAVYFIRKSELGSSIEGDDIKVSKTYVSIFGVRILLYSVVDVLD